MCEADCQPNAHASSFLASSSLSSCFFFCFFGFADFATIFLMSSFCTENELKTVFSKLSRSKPTSFFVPPGRSNNVNLNCATTHTFLHLNCALLSSTTPGKGILTIPTISVSLWAKMRCAASRPRSHVVKLLRSNVTLGRVRLHSCVHS